MPNTWLQDTRGPDGEIIAPSLVEGLSPTDALQWLAQCGLSCPRDLALPTLQQFRLRQALAGLRTDTLSAAIREAVLQQHEPLSLRPLGLEDFQPTSFAPLVQYLAEGQWRIGSPRWGRQEIFCAALPEQALATAQQMYAQWCAAENPPPPVTKAAEAAAVAVVA